MLNFLAQTTMPASQIVRDAHNFYSDAFTDLLWTMGVILATGFAVVGFIMPWLLERQRRENFKQSEEKVLAEINAAKADFQAEHKKLLADIHKAEDDLRNLGRRLGYVAIDSEFALALGQEEPYAKVFLLSRALDSAAHAGSEGKFRIILSALGECARDERLRIAELCGEDLEDIIHRIESVKAVIEKAIAVGFNVAAFDLAFLNNITDAPIFHRRTVELGTLLMSVAGSVVPVSSKEAVLMLGTERTVAHDALRDCHDARDLYMLWRREQ